MSKKKGNQKIVDTNYKPWGKAYEDEDGNEKAFKALDLFNFLQDGESIEIEKRPNGDYVLSFGKVSGNTRHGIKKFHHAGECLKYADNANFFWTLEELRIELIFGRRMQWGKYDK